MASDPGELANGDPRFGFLPRDGVTMADADVGFPAVEATANAAVDSPPTAAARLALALLSAEAAVTVVGMMLKRRDQTDYIGWLAMVSSI